MATVDREIAGSEIANAKVNLTLRVLGRRSDGYHELASVVAFAAIGDTVSIGSGPSGDADPVTVSGPFADGIVGGNLLARTLALLHTANPHLTVGTVHLHKRLPVAAGLGGGSADAAALLRAVRDANPTLAGDIPWMEIAAQLGSDVPVCLANRPALIQGRGERVAQLPHLPSMPAVIVNPRVPLSTAGVFAALQAGPAPPAAPHQPVPMLTGLAEALSYMRQHGNDLEPAAIGLLPVIGEIKGLLAAQAGCLHVAMSGSGPTCFGIFSSEASARHAAAAIAALRPTWWVEATSLTGVPQ